MADAVGTRLREAGVSGRTVTVKVRFADRATITRSHTASGALDSPRVIGVVSEALLGLVDVSVGVRLLGVSVSGLVEGPAPSRQLSFDDGAAPDDGSPAEARPPAWDEVEAAVSGIRARYGHASVGPAALVGPSGLAVKGRGDTQWGPDADGPDQGGAG
jgi:DNA polymerase-4